VGTAFAAGAVALDATNTQKDSALDLAGPALVAGDAIGMEVVTSGWTPITANLLGWVVVRLTP
jgi:hypothetical protein